MATTTAKQHTLVTVRLPRAMTDEVRLLAKRDAETQSTVFRRLLRAGLQAEQQRRESPKLEPWP